MEKEDLALHAKQVNYEKNQIVDSSYCNDVTNDKRKLQNMTEYKRSQVVVTTNNSEVPITSIGKTVALCHYNS